MKAAFLEWTIGKVPNASVQKRGWVKNLLYGKEILRETKLISYEMLVNWPHFESKGV